MSILTRIVRTTEGLSSPFVTGVGYLSLLGHVTAHSDSGRDYDEDAESLESIPVLYQSGRFWAFPTHNSCWSILNVRVPSCSSSEIARHLFGILWSTTYNTEYCLRPGHDFGGAVLFQSRVGDPVQDVAGIPWSFLNADPARFEALPSDALPLYQQTLRSCKALSEVVSTPTSCVESSPFSRLPVEIIHLLLAWLSLGDIAQLRLASRSIRNASRVDLLPQAFWRSRFWVDFDMGFALRRAYDVHRVRDWRALFFNYKDAHRNPKDDMGLKNRRRVWTALGSIPSLIRLLSRHEGMSGISIAWNDLSPLELHGKRRSSPELGPCINGETMDEHARLIYHGCRESTVRSMLWPEVSAHNGYRVGISIVSFNHQVFISGIRLCSLAQSQARSITQDRTLGLIDPSSEACFDIQPSENLAGFRVAVKTTGIVGLKLFVDGSQCRSSEWVGDVSTGGPDVAFGTLLPRQGREVFAVAAGFDVSLIGILHRSTERVYRA